MPIAYTETVSPLNAIPRSKLEGAKLGSPESVADSLMDHGGDAAQAMVQKLLPNGLTAEWAKGSHEEPIPHFAPGIYEALVASIADKQRPAQEIYDLTNERLPEFKKNIASRLALYGLSLGIDDANLEELFTSRIANIDEVKIIAPLAQGNTFDYITRHNDGTASLERKRGELRVDVDAIFDEVETGGLTAEEVISRSLYHELEHGTSVGATTPNGTWIIQSGLSALPQGVDNTRPLWHGTLLLDEGAQEQIRWRHLDGVPPTYEKGVMFWEAVIALDPKIEKLRFEAKFLGRNRGQLVGRIESLLGFGAIEDLEKFWNKQPGILLYPAFKDKLVRMINVYDPNSAEAATKTETARQIARQKLDETQKEILKRRGFDFTDTQMIQARALGATAANQVLETLARADLSPADKGK